MQTASSFEDRPKIDDGETGIKHPERFNRCIRQSREALSQNYLPSMGYI